MLENFSVQIRYIKSARRATIRLKPNNVVRVSVPFGVSESEVKRMLQSKSKWIIEKNRFLENVRNEPKLQFVSDELLPFCGQRLRLKIIEGYGSIVAKEDAIYVSVPKYENEKNIYIKAALEKWYKVQAIDKIEQRVAHYCALLGLRPRSISIKNYKARWGACSSKGDLIFNWQIIMFNQNLFDYVIAHEICHLKEMNHSKKFYQLLTSIGFQRKDIHPQIRHLQNLF
jgi:predicted metal-dependent hydrolase